MQVSTMSPLDSCAHTEIPQVKNKENRSELPTEVWTKILSFLAPEDMQITCLVNRAWRDMTLVAAQSEGRQIVKFVQYLIGKLDPDVHSTQIAQLREIIPSVQLGDAKNLRMVKKSLLEIKEQIAIILKDINHEIIKDLSDRSKEVYGPVFFENIYLVVYSHAIIDMCAGANSELPRNQKLLLDQFTVLALNRMNQGAIKALNVLVYNSEVRKQALLYLYLLVKDEDVENILKLASFLSTKDQDETYYHFAVWELIKYNSFRVAFQFCQKIPSQEIKHSISLMISKELTKLNRPDLLLDFKNVFDNQEDQLFVGRINIRNLIHQYKLNEASNFAASEPNEHSRNLLYSFMALSAVAYINVDFALKILERISDSVEKERCIKEILKATIPIKIILEADPITNRIKIAKATTDKNLKSAALWSLFEYALRNDFSRAKEIVNEMPFDEVRTYACSLIDRIQSQQKQREEKSVVMEFLDNYAKELYHFFTSK